MRKLGQVGASVPSFCQLGSDLSTGDHAESQGLFAVWAAEKEEVPASVGSSMAEMFLDLGMAHARHAVVYRPHPKRMPFENSGTHWPGAVVARWGRTHVLYVSRGSRFAFCLTP